MSTFRHALYPEYKANRRGAVDRRLAQVERRNLSIGPLPELEFSFALPDDLAFAIAPGPFAGIVGADISASGTVFISGRFAKDQLLRKVADFLIAVVPRGYRQLSITGVLERAGKPAESLMIEVVSGDPVVVISRANSSARPLIVGRATRR